MAAIPSLSPSEYLSRLVDRPLSEEVIERENTKKTFFEVIQRIIKSIDATPGQRSPTVFDDHLKRITSTLPENQLTKKVIALVSEFSVGLTENKTAVPPSDSNELEEWIMNLVIVGNIFLDSKIVRETKRIEIPEASLSVLKQLGKPLEALSCFEYAFFQAGLNAAYLGGVQHDEIPELLNEFGYTPSADPKSGDLILYLNHGIATHMGVYRDDGMVVSKWGNQVPAAYVHKVNMVPASYGDKIVYFRAPSS